MTLFRIPVVVVPGVVFRLEMQQDALAQSCNFTDWNWAAVCINVPVFLGWDHRNCIGVDLTIYQYMRKKLNCTGIWGLGCC